MRVPEIEWANQSTLYSLVSFNPGNCYHYGFICNHEIDRTKQFSIASTECHDLNNHMNKELALINWEGLDMITENKFILIADQGPGELKRTVYVLDISDQP